MGREAACGRHARAGFGARHGQDQDAQLAPAFLQADGYSGFGLLNEVANGQPAIVTEVACWAHVSLFLGHPRLWQRADRRRGAATDRPVV